MARNTVAVYDPIDGKAENYDLWPGYVQAPPNDILLTNILIELRVITQYLAVMNTGIVSDQPESMRLDEAKLLPTSVPNSVNFS